MFQDVLGAPRGFWGNLGGSRGIPESPGEPWTFPWGSVKFPGSRGSGVLGHPGGPKGFWEILEGLENSRGFLGVLREVLEILGCSGGPGVF